MTSGSCVASPSNSPRYSRSRGVGSLSSVLRLGPRSACLAASCFFPLRRLLGFVCEFLRFTNDLWNTSLPLYARKRARPRRRATALRHNDCGSVNGIGLQGNQCIVGLVEGKRRDLRPNFDFSCNRQEITSVGSRHIRNTADLTLAPKQPTMQ